MNRSRRRRKVKQAVHAGSPIPELLKQLRGRTTSLPTSKLLSLDYSDKILLAQRLTELIAQVDYLHSWAGAQCSVVLEVIDYYKQQSNDRLRAGTESVERTTHSGAHHEDLLRSQ